jgi:glycosyltransferase involved in cell wall biosynthesis
METIDRSKINVVSFSSFYFQEIGGAEMSVRALSSLLDTATNHIMITPSKVSDNAYIPQNVIHSFSDIKDWALLVGTELLDRHLYNKMKGLYDWTQVDIIHIHDMFLLPSASRIARKNNIPYVVTVRDPLPKPLWTERFSLPIKTMRAAMLYMRNPRYKRDLSRADGIITVSKYIKEMVCDFTEIDTDKVTPIYNAAEFPRTEIEVLDSNKDVVYSVQTRLVPEKGVNHFIDAISILHSRGLNIKGVILGKGDQKKALQNQAQKLGISDRIEFAGYISDREKFRRFLLNTDVLVSAAIYPEPFTRIVLDAYCMNKAIVLTKAGGSLDLLDWGIAEFADPDNSQSLANAMERVYSFEKRVQFAKVLEQKGKIFESKNVLDQHLKKYTQIINQ